MIDHHLNRAQRLYQRGDTRGAVDLLLSLIGAFPGDARGYLGLAEVMRDLGEPGGALSALGELPPAARDLRADMLMALTLVDAGRLAEAAALARRLAADPAGLLVEGRIAAREGRLPEALGLLRRAVAADPGSGEAMTCLGQCLWDGGDTAAALDMMARGLEAAPSRSEAAVCYCRAAAAVGADDHAEPVLGRVFEALPGNERTACLYIDVLLRRGALETAMAAVKRAMAALSVGDGLLDGALAIRRRLPAPPVRRQAPRVSLCMIVKNEQAQLARCLYSVVPVVDEMVIVDTGSTDRTRDVARVFGARVVDAPWRDDFSAARNAGLDQAAGQWILVMDADETLSRQDHDVFRQLIERAPAGAAAFTLTTRNYINRLNAVGWQPSDERYRADAEGFGWFASDKVRLFPNRPAVRFRFPVHELVEPSLAAAGIAVYRCPVPVHHYGKLDDAAATAKGERYFRIGMAKLSHMAQDPAALRELAVQALNLERWQDGAALWERLDRMQPRRADVLLNLATAYLNTGRIAAAVDTAEAAVRLSPEMKEAGHNLAFALLHAGRAGQAVSVAGAVCRRHPHYLGARFVLAAARAVTGDAAGADREFRALADTVIGDGLFISCRTLAGSLSQAGQAAAAEAVLGRAAGAGIMPPDRSATG